MPNYKAFIQLQDAVEGDYRLLTERLKRKSFNKFEDHTKNASYHFRKENTMFHHVANELLTAAKKTGKSFSFTIEITN